MADPTGMDTTAIVRTRQFREQLLCFNGRNRPRDYDGVNWSNCGIEQGCPVTEANATSISDRSPVTPTFALSGGAQIVSAAALASGVVTLTSVAHGLPVGAFITARLGQAIVVNNASLTSGVAEITTTNAHALSVGDMVTVQLLSGPLLFADLNGTFVVTVVPSATTFRYAKSHLDIVSGAATGLATGPDTTYPSDFEATGVQIITAVPTANTLTYTTTPASGAPDVGTVVVSGTAQRYFLPVATFQRSSNVATVQTGSVARPVSNGFLAGESVRFHGTTFAALLNVTATVVTALPGGIRFTFASTGADVALTTLTGINVDRATSEVDNAASATLTGTYRYFYAAANANKLNVEGRPTEAIPSNISAEIVVSAQRVTLNNIPATHEDAQVTGFNIYRNKSGVYDTDVTDEQQDFFFIGTVALGTTTYVDNSPDDALTGAERLRFNQNIPPTCKFGAIYGERMFMAGFDPITAGTATNTHAITSARRTSTTANITSSNHGFKIGDSITVALLTGPTGFAALNGTWTVTAVATNDLTFETVTSGTISSGAATGTFIAPLYIDFSSTLPDGVVGTWFKKDGETAVYRVVRRISATRVRVAALVFGDQVIASGFVGTLSAATFSIYRDPWDVYFSEFQDAEAWGPNGDGTRFKREIPGRQAVTGLMTFGGMLLVFTEHKIYPIMGQGPNAEDVQLRPDPLFNGLGAVSHDAIVQVDNQVHFLSHRGVAVLAGSEPQLIGIPLNTDWLDTLNASEKAIAVMGTDDDDVYLSVPVSGQTLNSKTFRYERQTQSWWEETEMCPTLFVRQDADNGYTDILFYIQGKLICRPNKQTYDLLSAAVTGTAPTITRALSGIAVVTDGGDPTVQNVTLTFSGGLDPNLLGDVTLNITSNSVTFPNGNYGNTNFVSNDTTIQFAIATSLGIPDMNDAVLGTVSLVSWGGTTFNDRSDGVTFPTLTECYVRFYSAGVFVGSRRIISSAGTNQIQWSASSALPGSGVLAVLPGWTYEIGNVGWQWVTKTDEVPGHLKRTMDVNVSFDRSSTASIHKLDIIDGVEETIAPKNIECANHIAYKYPVERANRTYAARFSSRDGAVLRHVTIGQQTEAGQV